MSDNTPGVCRLRAGKGFRYVRAKGGAVRSTKELTRIRALAIPPAWIDVWICPRPNGHLQATGRDARGRKQYRYHPRWREIRDANKFERLADFGRVLPRLRRRIRRDLARRGLPREKVLALVVKLLERTGIRVGNEEYRRENGSYGLTTMHNKHVKLTRNGLSFAFPGKSGIFHHVDLLDPRLARAVRACQGLPGQRLFQFRDEAGTCHSIDSNDVNDYLRAITGQEVTAKDFRTWAGTVLAAQGLRELADKPPTKKLLLEVIAQVALSLGNTRAICRKCYIHPAVIEMYLAGKLAGALAEAPPLPGLSQRETALLGLLDTCT